MCGAESFNADSFNASRGGALCEVLEVSSEDQVGTYLGTDQKGSGSGFDEAVASVEGNGAEVAGVGAEQEACAVEAARVGDGSIHECLRWPELGYRRVAYVKNWRTAETGE